MSTNASISVQVNNKSLESLSVYLHWDGYPSNAGVTLLKHYNTHEKVLALVNMGDISSLHESIECPDGHTFDNSVDGYCVFYGRDRGEINYECVRIPTPTDAITQEFNYTFTKGSWWVQEPARGNSWKKLTSAMCR